MSKPLPWRSQNPWAHDNENRCQACNRWCCGEAPVQRRVDAGTRRGDATEIRSALILRTSKDTFNKCITRLVYARDPSSGFFSPDGSHAFTSEWHHKQKTMTTGFGSDIGSENRRDLVAILQCKYSVTAMMTSLSWDTSHTLVDEENIMMVCGFGPALPLKTFSKALIRRHYLLSSSDQSKFGSCAAIYRDYFQPLSFSGRAFILLLWHLSHPSLTITHDISPVCPPNAVFHSLISIWRLFRSR